MDTKTRTTKQGLRDLNFYGSRKKAAEASADGTLAAAESGAPTTSDAAIAPATTTPIVAAVTTASGV